MFDEELPAEATPEVTLLPGGVRRICDGPGGWRLVYPRPRPRGERDDPFLARLRGARRRAGRPPAGAVPAPPSGAESPQTVADVERLVETLPGDELAAWLITVDVSGLSEPSSVAVVRGWERVKDWASAQQNRALAALPHTEDSTVDDALREEVAVALTIAPTTAGNRLAAARQLCGPLEETLDAVEAGRVSAAAAAALARGTWELPDEQARVVQDAVLPEAGELTPARVARAVRQARVAAAGPDAAARRRAAAEERSVHVDAAPHDMAWLTAYLPVADVAAAVTVLDTLVDTTGGPDDPRTPMQRRADAFGDVFRRLLDGGGLPTRQRRRT